MQESPYSLPVLGAAVLVSALGCSVNQAQGRSTPDSSAPAKSASRDSARFGYSWILSDGWKFVAPGPFWQAPPDPSMDVHAAASKDAKGPVLVTIVTDVSETIPGKPASDEPKGYDELVQYGAQVLRDAGATLASSERIRMFNLDGLQVTGTDGRFRISIRLLNRGDRRFEFRCFDPDQNAQWRCASALTSFQIADAPAPQAPPANSQY